ncbi:unnamed protein product [Chrysoparadoxa australica]
MLTKFESKSNRVKGLSFHPKRPWILTSLHNGIIQLWDYRMGTLLDRFDEHDGPVRGVDFHKSQPLIVSGGDDYKIKVWDYKLRRCLFTLLGHLDYIRTVQFHHEYPWIVSASDDQTIRIWNWQSRTCLAVLTGHNHYVMCAGFHPKDDLIVSASLDQTVRVWDVTALRKKTVRGAPSLQDDNALNKVNNELFGGTDAVVKYVLEGHDRGVNWASFHPTLPLVISGADDRQVKLWRMNETKAWEVHTMTGHSNNVSCALFHPKRELILSNSEDRSIRVWDISQRMGVQTFRRESDRFWILAAHPTQNLLAAGHDSGMIVFKLERERPAYDVHKDKLYYVKDRYLRMADFKTGRDVPVVSLRRGGQNSNGIGHGPRTLQYNTFNPAEHQVLIMSTAEGGSYELLTFSESGSGASDAQDTRRGSALSASFIARNRFAVLDKTRHILIKNFQNEVTKRISPVVPNADELHFAGSAGRIMLRSDDRVTLYDQQSRRVMAELMASRVKYVYWSHDSKRVALVSKHGVVMADKHLKQLCTVSETVRVKSGAWDANNRIFTYSTLNHVKYLLPNGDTGIIRTLDVPLYLTKTEGVQLHCLDREGKTRVLGIDSTEALFKLALEDKRFGEVMHMVQHSRLEGQAIISYLKEKGYPEVALHFVSDNKTKFRLALACGNIEVAMHTAYELPDESIWHQLGIEALRQGNHQVVEMAYQRTKNFERLSFLYLLTGNTDKLKKMLKIAERRGDLMARFHNALFLGDAADRVAILEGTGQLALAYLCAASHGLEEDAQRLKELLEAQGAPVPDVLPGAQLLQPPTPIIRGDNWPLLAVAKGPIDGAVSGENGREDPAVEQVKWEEPVGEAWADDDLDLDDDEEEKVKESELGLSTGGGEWADDDLDLGDDLDLDLGPAEDAPARAPMEVGDYVLPTPGPSCKASWCNSSHAADHAAAGDFEGAMKLLNRQIAVVNFRPLFPLLMRIYSGARTSVPGLVGTPSLISHLRRTEGNRDESLPKTSLTLPPLVDMLKSAYRFFQAGKFGDARSHLDAIIVAIPLVVVETKGEGSELKELLEICREYVTAIRLKHAIGDVPDDPKRSMELAAYFTHCNLQPAHLLLALRLAMVAAFKNKNFITAASFAQRLLELPDMGSERNSELKIKAQKILQKSRQMARNEVELDYDERNPFVVDCATLKPIYKGASVLRCPYCGSSFGPESKGQVCCTCGLSQVGVETLGLVTSGRK